MLCCNCLQLNALPIAPLQRQVLVDTPVAPYFEKYFNDQLKSQDSKDAHDIQKVYNEVEIDIIDNMLQKLWCVWLAQALPHPYHLLPMPCPALCPALMRCAATL